MLRLQSDVLRLSCGPATGRQHSVLWRRQTPPSTNLILRPRYASQILAGTAVRPADPMLKSGQCPCRRGLSECPQQGGYDWVRIAAALAEIQGCLFLSD